MIVEKVWLPIPLHLNFTWLLLFSSDPQLNHEHPFSFFFSLQDKCCFLIPKYIYFSGKPLTKYYTDFLSPLLSGIYSLEMGWQTEKERKKQTQQRQNQQENLSKYLKHVESLSTFPTASLFKQCFLVSLGCQTLGLSQISSQKHFPKDNL